MNDFKDESEKTSTRLAFDDYESRKDTESVIDDLFQSL